MGRYLDYTHRGHLEGLRPCRQRGGRGVFQLVREGGEGGDARPLGGLREGVRRGGPHSGQRSITISPSCAMSRGKRRRPPSRDVAESFGHSLAAHGFDRKLGHRPKGPHDRAVQELFPWHRRSGEGLLPEGCLGVCVCVSRVGDVLVGRCCRAPGDHGHVHPNSPEHYPDCTTVVTHALVGLRGRRCRVCLCVFVCVLVCISLYVCTKTCFAPLGFCAHVAAQWDF